jgi:hypothetical protein
MARRIGTFATLVPGRIPVRSGRRNGCTRGEQGGQIGVGRCQPFLRSQGTGSNGPTSPNAMDAVCGRSRQHSRLHARVLRAVTTAVLMSRGSACANESAAGSVNGGRPIKSTPRWDQHGSQYDTGVLHHDIG